MVDISKFLESERKAKERNPEQYERERKEDARRAWKDFDRYSDEKLMTRYDRMKNRSGGGSGGAGVSNTRQLQLGADLDPKAMMKREDMKKGGKVKAKSASSRGDGIAQRGKTKGRMV
jgi:hypothetical protein